MAFTRDRVITRDYQWRCPRTLLVLRFVQRDQTPLCILKGPIAVAPLWLRISIVSPLLFVSISFTDIGPCKCRHLQPAMTQNWTALASLGTGRARFAWCIVHRPHSAERPGARPSISHVGPCWSCSLSSLAANQALPFSQTPHALPTKDEFFPFMQHELYHIASMHPLAHASFLTASKKQSSRWLVDDDQRKISLSNSAPTSTYAPRATVT